MAQLIEAGRALNEVAHRAHADEALPPDEEVILAVTRVYGFVAKAVPGGRRNYSRASGR